MMPRSKNPVENFIIETLAWMLIAIIGIALVFELIVLPILSIFGIKVQ